MDENKEELTRDGRTKVLMKLRARVRVMVMEMMVIYRD